MQELYSVDRKQYLHYQQVQISPEKKWHSYDTVEKEVSDERFKDLLLSMPKDDWIRHTNDAFKISQDGSSFRISFFDFEKKTRYIRGKHQLEKQLYLVRFIIKKNSNNFYVSTITFGNRKRHRDMKQNILRFSQIQKFAGKMAYLLIRKYTPVKFDESAGETPPDRLISTEMRHEIAKITDTIIEALNATTTPKAIQVPNYLSEVARFFEDLLMGSILEWFCRKNGVKVDYFWLTKLISFQYMTKKQLKTYNNNYLQAFLDYYQFTPDVVPYLKNNIRGVLNEKRDLVTLSVFEKIYPKDGYRFTYESEVAPINGEKRYLMDTKIYLRSIYKLYDEKDRGEFKNFLDYLAANKRYFREQKVLDNLEALRDVIRSLAKLYRMGIKFKFIYLDELVSDPAKLEAFNKSVRRLTAESGRFMILHFSPKYKKKVEQTFTMYGEKWKISMMVKPILDYEATDDYFMSNHFTAAATNMNTGETLEMDLCEPHHRSNVHITVNRESLKKYYSARMPVVFNMEELGIAGDSFTRLSEEKNELMDILRYYAGVPKKFTRKAPSPPSRVIFTLRKVHKIFYDSCRYFNVDYQILVPILERIIAEDKFLNNYTTIKK